MTHNRLEGLRAAASVAAVSLFAACAAGIAANKRSPGAVENGAFKPTRPPAAAFGAPDPTFTCPAHGHNGAVQQGLDERLKGQKIPQPDGRLCAIADTLLGWPGGEKNEMPPEDVRSFLSQYFGVPSTVRQILITTLETEKEADVATALVDPIATFASTAQQARYGMMTDRLKKNSTKVVLVMWDETLVFDSPVPRKLAPNTNAPLSGHLVGAVKTPKVQVVDPLGKLEKTNPSEGQTFRTEIKCAVRPGKILVQVAGELEGAEVLAANFGVACGTEPAVSAKLPSAAPGPVDPAAAEKKLSEMINADRESVGLKPLHLHEALSSIARGISENRAKGKGFSSTELTQKMKEADIATPQILESAAQAFGIDEAYSRFADSPPDRATEMRTDITDMGVGVSKGPEVGGKPTIIVTELFVTQLPPPDAEVIKKKLYEAINKKRSEAGKPAVEKDATLETVAQNYADAAVKAGGPVPKDKEGDILAPLYKASMTVNQMGGFVPTEEVALSVADQPAVLGDGKLIGVGVAVGRSPQYGKNSPFVMVLVGTRHAAPKAVGKVKRKK